MSFSKKLFAFLTLIVFVIIGLAATQPPKDRTFKNLQVLPKNIGSQDLYRIMHNFNKDLGVNCGFCHARSEQNPDQVDFVSDKKGEKEICRSMMKMTNRINKKFFHVKQPMVGDSISVVTCFTCHHGAAIIEKKP